MEELQAHVAAPVLTGLQVEASEQSVEQDDEVEFECGVAPLTGCQKATSVKLVCKAGAQESKRELGQVILPALKRLPTVLPSPGLEIYIVFFIDFFENNNNNNKYKHSFLCGKHPLIHLYHQRRSPW